MSEPPEALRGVRGFICAGRADARASEGLREAGLPPGAQAFGGYPVALGQSRIPGPGQNAAVGGRIPQLLARLASGPSRLCGA